MQKSKLVTTIIILIILIYGLLSNLRFVYGLNGLYLYIINPIFWIIFCVVLFFALGKLYTNTKLRKKIIQYTTVATLTYLIVYMFQ